MKVLQGLGWMDDPNEGWCVNVYINNDTGTTYVERVWDNSGVTVVGCKGLVTEITLQDFDIIKKEWEDVTW